jgi:hypothetical protein
MEAGMASHEVLHRLALMNGVLIPHQDDGVSHLPEQVSQKSQYFLASQSARMRVDAQAEFFPAGETSNAPSRLRRTLWARLVYTMGGCPLGAQVRLSGETSEKPLSSSKTKVA